MSRPLRVVVVGGSIGGLTTALLLRDLGHEVEIHERSSSPLNGLGAGIIAHEPVLRYFAQRSSIALDDITISSSAVRYLDRQGTVTHELPVGYRFTAWHSVHRGLASLFPERNYHLSRPFERFDLDGETVQVSFADGTKLEADLLICADGINSTARRQMFGERVQYSGYVGWRGMAYEHDLDPAAWELLSDAFSYGIHPGGHGVTYPIPTTGDSVAVNGRCVNVLWYENVPEGAELTRVLTDRDGVQAPNSIRPGRISDAALRHRRKQAHELLPAPMAHAFDVVRDPFITAITDADTPGLVDGRVALVGDSGVAARPHGAAGAAKAGALAWALAEHLEREPDVPAALRLWEAEQLPRSRSLLYRTRDMGDRLQFGGVWDPTDPSNQFGVDVPERDGLVVPTVDRGSTS